MDRQQRQINLHEKLADQYLIRYGYDYSKLFQKYWNNQLINLCLDGGKSCVLDFGCGNGVLIPDLVKNFTLVYGLDMSFKMLKSVKENWKGSKGAIVGDGNHLPFKDKSFNSVVCRGVTHHIPNINLTLNEVHRILKKDGVFVFSEPCNDSFIVRLARKIMYKKSKSFDEDDKAFLQRDLETIINKNGKFSIEKIERFGFVAYALAGFPDHISILKYFPFNQIIAKILIVIDKVLAKIPFVKRQSLHIIMKLRSH